MTLVTVWKMAEDIFKKPMSSVSSPVKAVAVEMKG